MSANLKELSLRLGEIAERNKEPKKANYKKGAEILFQIADVLQGTGLIPESLEGEETFDLDLDAIQERVRGMPLFSEIKIKRRSLVHKEYVIVNGEKLEKAREEKGITIGQLGKALHRSRQTVEYWERCGWSFPLPEAIALAKVLGIDSPKREK
ncbi:MAG: helix-turn-helix domain-containing protein [Patescibacteria group bacterium]|nr:helix-turn-helix domain-containing protein [Patescibacteria group bacterium]